MKQRAKSQKVFEKILDFFARACYNEAMPETAKTKKEESRMGKAEYAAPIPEIEREVEEIIKQGPFEGPAAGHPGRAYEES